MAGAGAAISIVGGTPYLFNNIFTNNSGTFGGMNVRCMMFQIISMATGALSLTVVNNVALSLNTNTFTQNYARNGGAVYIVGQTSSDIAYITDHVNYYR